MVNCQISIGQIITGSQNKIISLYIKNGAMINAPFFIFFQQTKKYLQFLFCKNNGDKQTKIGLLK
jgi:hypothetical protein